MKLTSSRVLGICLIISASVLTASASQADTDTLTACVKKSNGAARIISGKMKCLRGERLVTWTSTSDSLIGPAGARGATGVEGPTGPAGATGPIGATGAAGPAGRDGVDGVNGTNGHDGAVGATGAQGIQGPAGATGPAGANGTNGVNGISKVLVASGNQVSINQGSEGVILSTTIPAGKYVMDLSASLNYSNRSTSMSGMANFACFLTSSSNYVDAATTPDTNLWPEVNNASPFRLSFEIHAASGDEVMKRSFSNTGLVNLASSTSVKWLCRHYSSVADDPNEQIIIRYPRLVLTAVDEIVALN